MSDEQYATRTGSRTRDSLSSRDKNAATQQTRRSFANYDGGKQQDQDANQLSNLDMRIQKKQAALAQSVRQSNGSQSQLIGDAKTKDGSEGLPKGSGKSLAVNPSLIQRQMLQIAQIDDKLKSAKTLTDSKFKQLNDTMGVIQEFIQDDKEFREQLNSIRREEIRQLEDIVDQRFERESKARIETEKQMESIIEEQFAQLQSEILKQKQARQHGYEALESQLDEDFPKLQDCNKAEAHEREEQDAAMIKKVIEETDQVTKRIHTEKRAREASEEQVLDLIKGMVDTIRNDLAVEKQAREQSEEQLLLLLEDTCTKLNNAASQDI